MKKMMRYFLRSLRNTYTVNYIFRQETPDHIDEIKKRVTERNYMMFIASSFLVVLVTVLFVVSDISSGFYQENYPYSILNMAAEITHLSVVLLLIINIFDTRERNIKKKRFYIVAYWLLCSVGCSIYSLSDAMRSVVSSGPYFALVVLVIAPVFFEAEFWLYFGIYLIPTIIYYVLSGHFDVMNLILNLIAYIIHLFLTAAYTREQLLNIKYEESHEELVKMNRTDFLTKIGNRQMLYETLDNNKERWIAEEKEICLVMMDIDHFKCYNDTFSHLQGDNCLISISTAVSKVLSERVSAETTFIRFGGEEFLIMLVGEKLEPVLFDMYDGIRQEIEKLSIPSGKGATYPYVTISAGAEITRYTYAVVIEELMRRADNQLYHVKAEGRNALGYCDRIIRKDAEHADESAAETRKE